MQQTSFHTSSQFFWANCARRARMISPGTTPVASQVQDPVRPCSSSKLHANELALGAATTMASYFTTGQPSPPSSPPYSQFSNKSLAFRFLPGERAFRAACG